MRKRVAGTPADPTIRFARLVVDGNTHRLVYRFNAIALAEDTAKCNLLSGLENLGDLTALQLRGLLYAALTPLQPTVTIEAASALVRLDTIGAVTDALAEAYALSMPDPTEGAAAPKN